jgi:16S rRNA (guanine966-N2)-methyltransferase
VRETLFNWLQGLTLDEDCIDLYAGSGACGLEALSRGARHVVFVDTSAAACAAITAHLAALDSVLGKVHKCSARQFIESAALAGTRFGLVFMDPPFASGVLLNDCAALEASGLLKARARIYLESGEALPESGAATNFPGNWVLRKHGKAGAVFYGLYERHEVTA